MLIVVSIYYAFYQSMWMYQIDRGGWPNDVIGDICMGIMISSLILCARSSSQSSEWFIVRRTVAPASWVTWPTVVPWPPLKSVIFSISFFFRGRNFLKRVFYIQCFYKHNIYVLNFTIWRGFGIIFHMHVATGVPTPLGPHWISQHTESLFPLMECPYIPPKGTSQLSVCLASKKWVATI